MNWKSPSGASAKMEGRAGEAFAPRDIGIERLVEKAGGADEGVRDIRAAPGRLDMPATVGEARGDDLLLEANEFEKAAAARDLPDIGPDLGGRRLFARPAVIGLERELVVPRQDIDEEAGKGVVPPGPADPFIGGEVDPRALQRLGHEQPGHARAGDDNPKSPIRRDASQGRPDPCRPKVKPLAAGATSHAAPVGGRLTRAADLDAAERTAVVPRRHEWLLRLTVWIIRGGSAGVPGSR
jgi:hypothetical protein